MELGWRISLNDGGWSPWYASTVGYLYEPVRHMIETVNASTPPGSSHVVKVTLFREFSNGHSDKIQYRLKEA